MATTQIGVAVYGLFASDRPNECRYVGQTTNLVVRFRRHLRRAKNGENTHRSAWMRAVLSRGGSVFYKVLGWTEGKASADILERHLIAALKSEGADLTNMTDGGGGGSVRGAKRTPEARARIRASKLGRPLSEDHRQILSMAHKGKTLSPEHRANIGRAHKGMPKPKPIGWRNSGSFKKGAIPWNKRAVN